MIKKVYSIQELYEFIGLNRTPIFECFDILTHQETYPETHKMVLPHRRDFYSVIFIENQQQGNMSINHEEYKEEKDLLFFQSPEHVFSFVRGEAMRGFLLFFKLEFLLPHIKDIVSEFSFFSSTVPNVFKLNKDEKKEIVFLFESILKEHKNEKLSKYLVLALLEKSKVLHKNKELKKDTISIDNQILNTFKRLVNNHFIEYKTVSFYASELNYTPNYLNDRIKKLTGKTAKEHIVERILLEAKNMLKYTSLDIAEISYILQFNEPSYFGRFFKKYAKITPRMYRNM